MPDIAYVDENDMVVGSGTKEEAWEKGIINRVSRMFLFNSKGELLMQKRAAHLTSFPGRYDSSAAGHVDAGEEYEVAALRELEEEIGVKDIRLSEKGKFFSEEADKGGGIRRRFNMVYTATYDGEVSLKDGEVAETQWIHPDAKTTSEWYHIPAWPITQDRYASSSIITTGISMRRR